MKKKVLPMSIVRIKTIIWRLLTVVPVGRKLMPLIRFNFSYRRNFGKIKFQG
jgi:hypothetical protein